jgi:hypothetical protein
MVPASSTKASNREGRKADVRRPNSGASRPRNARIAPIDGDDAGGVRAESDY